MVRVIGLIGGFFCAAVNSATLSFPEEFYPLQVDEKVIEHSWFSKVRTLELAPGSYEVKIKYSDLYEIGYDEHEVVESAPFWIHLQIEQEGDYQVRFERANQVELARAFATQPIISIQFENENAMKAVNVAKPQTANTVVAEKATINGPVTAPNVPTTPKAPISPLPSAGMMLDFWWQQATEQERAAFLKRVSQ
ncbi:hypothetical protein PALB_15240 [Pseudoalteromonas luteoviolacea B = ATCC 29581]|nr:hypothetical protein PALB_15240 [Pseudoalteromonas luteoviolacea B = ATCC 29581]